MYLLTWEWQIDNAGRLGRSLEVIERKGTYLIQAKNTVAISRQLFYNFAAFDFRVFSQYPVISANQRVTCLPKKPSKVSALNQQKGTLQHHGNRNSEVV
jgi:hypothetical protein